MASSRAALEKGESFESDLDKDVTPFDEDILAHSSSNQLEQLGRQVSKLSDFYLYIPVGET